MSKEEIITKVNGFLVDEFEIDAALLNDNAALKRIWASTALTSWTSSF